MLLERYNTYKTYFKLYFGDSSENPFDILVNVASGIIGKIHKLGIGNVGVTPLQNMLHK